MAFRMLGHRIAYAVTQGDGIGNAVYIVNTITVYCQHIHIQYYIFRITSETTVISWLFYLDWKYNFYISFSYYE